MKKFLSKTAGLNRAIVSDDLAKTLHSIGERIPLTVHAYKTGTKCFDWVIPKKWVIRDAYIETLSGKRVLDWKENPLHVIVGSLPVQRTKISKKELIKRIAISEKYPKHIPYHFKYYELDWGFCMAKKDLKKLTDDEYYVAIDSEYVNGELLVGEHVIKGKSKKCITLISHIDHPAQVNDGLAGAAVLIKLAESLHGTKPTYTIRMHFLSETIGSIAYLHHNPQILAQTAGAIFCEAPGTPNYPIVLQHAKRKDSSIDVVAASVLRHSEERVEFADCFTHIVNDDGFYNSPGIDIPCISLSRSKKLTPKDWFHFPYYHTSGDSIEHFDFKQAQKYLEYVQRILAIFDADRVVTKTYRGVPNLSRHGLWLDWQIYPNASQNIDAILFNLDDGISMFELSEKTGVPFDEVHAFIKNMEEKHLVTLSLP
ncbi:MAG: DUF4910 domain-containing protein [Candidatus Paceibacterota bacterium]|jgi:aminopeptidase-like protein